MTRQYDLVVIGTGTGGSGAASRCRSAGWRVAVIDHLPFGGTCALRGSIRRRSSSAPSEAIDHLRRMRGKGIAGGAPEIAWHELIAFKRTFTEPGHHEGEAVCEERYRWDHGRARFAARSVEVGGEMLEGRFILIAVGAVPMRLGIPGGTRHHEHRVPRARSPAKEDRPARRGLHRGRVRPHRAERART